MDPFAGYQKKWAVPEGGEPEDPFAAYESRYGEAARPVAGAPSSGPPPAAAAATLPSSPSRAVAGAAPSRFPDLQPRYDRFGEPMNEAARDVETAQSAAPTPGESMTARTRALGFGVGLGRGALNFAALPFQALRATFPSGPTAAMRGAPPTARAAPPVAGFAGAPQGGPPGTGVPEETAAFLRGLNPLPLLQRIGQRDPEAIGELGGLYLGGRIGEAATRVPPGTDVVRGAGATPEAAQAFHTLGLDARTATEADVRGAWRSVAQRTHPDVPPAERAARGGPADPIVAAQEFNRATQARETALGALGRERPAPGFQAPAEEAQFRGRQAQGTAATPAERAEPPTTAVVTPPPERAPVEAEARAQVAPEPAIVPAPAPETALPAQAPPGAAVQPPAGAPRDQAAIQEGLFGEPSLTGHEQPDYERLAHEQASEIPPTLQRQMVDRLAEQGGNREELQGLAPRDLAQRALDARVLTARDESRLMDALLPDLGALVRPQARPTAAGNVPAIPKRGVVDELRRHFLPESRSPEATATARITTAAFGQLARKQEIALAQLAEARKRVPKLDTPEGIRFSHDMETGSPVAKELEPYAKLLREMADDRRKQVQALGTGKLEHFIENWLGHLWEKPEAAAAYYRGVVGRRPIEGPKGFLRPRTHDTIADGMDAGLKPLTPNLVDMQLMKIHEMDRYIMAHREILRPLKGDGLIRFKEQPDGWVRINDNIFTVHAPRTEQGAEAIRGYYYAPEPVARIINNDFSPGLGSNPIFQAVMGPGNALNAAELGLSTFHAKMSVMSSMGTRATLGVRLLRAGEVGRGLGAIASFPAAPFAQVLNGIRLGRAYRAPGSAGVGMERLANALADAGGRLRLDRTYMTSTIAAFQKAARDGNIPMVVARGLGLVLRGAAWPIMEGLVPALKRGAFYDRARAEMRLAGPGADPHELTQRLQDVWKDTDDVFGQMNYDNLHWNRAVKDSMHMLFRAFGWLWGTARKFGGAADELAHGRWGRNMDHIAGFLIPIGLAGALWHYLHTGKAVASAQDVFHPQNGGTDELGNPDRDDFITYARDAESWFRHPVQTPVNKLNPGILAVTGLLRNRDWRGDEIVNPNDPTAVKLQQLAKFFRDEFTPISLTPQQRGLAGQVSPVRPALREDIRTPAQNALLEAGHAHAGGRTPEQVARSDSLRQAGTERFLSANQRLVERFRRLPPADREYIYGLGDAHEKALWAPYVARRAAAHHR